jgi:hypothetical protein
MPVNWNTGRTDRHTQLISSVMIPRKEFCSFLTLITISRASIGPCTFWLCMYTCTPTCLRVEANQQGWCQDVSLGACNYKFGHIYMITYHESQEYQGVCWQRGSAPCQVYAQRMQTSNYMCPVTRAFFLLHIQTHPSQTCE